MTIDLDELKTKLPLPELMRHLGLGNFAKPSCKSPFRSDDHPSWGIYRKDGRWYWKDFATGEHGDEIAFLAQYYQLDQRTDFRKLLEYYSAIANDSEFLPDQFDIEPVQTLPDQTGFQMGTDDQIQLLAELRSISVAGLNWASMRGVLVFGIWHDTAVFGVHDQSGKILEIRRLDGELFPETGNLASRKSERWWSNGCMLTICSTGPSITGHMNWRWVTCLFSFSWRAPSPARCLMPADSSLSRKSSGPHPMEESMECPFTIASQFCRSRTRKRPKEHLNQVA